MKIPFTLTDFSKGMKGKKGQFNQADLTCVQDLNNILVERNNTLRSRNGVEDIDYPLLANDKVLPFVSNGRQYYFIYDPLLNLKYTTPYIEDECFSMGGQRHVDIFSRYNSSLSLMEYLGKEVENHRNLVQGQDDITYIKEDVSFPDQDDVAKWEVLKDAVADGLSDLDLHLYLRKLTWESSPTCVATERSLYPKVSAKNLYQSGLHTVKENTFWWNRMFILDEDLNIITNEIDIANYVAYDSGHEPLTAILPLDSEVRGSTHASLQTIREARYGGSDLEYEVEVLNQGVLFYNREGKLPNMFFQLNDEGQTDGVLRDFRTLYLDEVPNGIFKTAPYFTLDEYANNDLFNLGRQRLDLEYITAEWEATDNLINRDDYFQAVALQQSFFRDNEISDTGFNKNIEITYNVRDPQNQSDVVKATLPLTSDSSPAVEIDNIRFKETDGQVRFASPSFANFDRDFLFPHDATEVFTNTDLAADLPFLFSPELVIYVEDTILNPVTDKPEKAVLPLLTLQNNAASELAQSLTFFSMIPISRYSGGSLGKFNSTDVAFRPVRITGLTDSTTVTTEDASYLAAVPYTQVFSLVEYDASLLTTVANDNTFPIRLGYFIPNGKYNIFYPLNNFKAFGTTYEGYSRKTSSGLFSSSSTTNSYSFTIYFHNGGSEFSIIGTNFMQSSKATGFNAHAYFSSVSEFQTRLYLLAKEAPNRIIYSSTTDYLDFSTISARVNDEAVSAVSRGGRELLGNEQALALHVANNSQRVITNRRILSIGINEAAVVVLSDPSDIVTSGKSPVTINNFTYFVSGNNRDVLLAVFSDKTQRFEYYSVFNSINIDDESEIISLQPIASSYRMVVRTENALYIGTIMQANQVAWSRLTFDFIIESVSTTDDTLFIRSNEGLHALQFVEYTDLEDGVKASMKMLAPTAMANLVNVPKTNVNYIGMQLQDITVVGTFSSSVISGSDANPIDASVIGDVVQVANKNYDDIYDSIELSFEGGQNRIVYIRGSLGV